MRVTIETNQPLSETEVEILTLLLGKHPSPSTETASPATKKPTPAKRTPKPSKAKEEPVETPDEETPAETPDDTPEEKPAPAPKKAPAKKADTADLDALLTEATEAAMELMNQGNTDQVKAALATTGAKKVSAIDNSEDAAKFLAAIKGE